MACEVADGLRLLRAPAGVPSLEPFQWPVKWPMVCALPSQNTLERNDLRSILQRSMIFASLSNHITLKSVEIKRCKAFRPMALWFCRANRIFRPFYEGLQRVLGGIGKISSGGASDNEIVSTRPAEW